MIKKHSSFIVKNYNPLNIVFNKGKNIYLYDTNNNKYIDCISGYSSINQGHCHPKIYNEMKNQAKKLTLTSRALHNSKIEDFSKKISKLMNYDKVIMMNSGVEAGETALKISRLWGYKNKSIEENKAVNLFCKNNFWGRTLAACSSSTDPLCYKNFGPYQNGFSIIEYNNLSQLERKFKSNPNIVSFMLEPIQGEAGVIIPDIHYLKEVRKLCNKYNILMILDEVQTGLGRTGKFLACDYENMRPDLLILGKSLSGGFYPISCVLGNHEIMNLMTPGTHGSTYGGNPLACSIGIAALDVILDENLIENSFEKGIIFRNELMDYKKDFITSIRGKGLFNAIECKNSYYANKLHNELLKNKVITKITHSTILRISPPLVINNKQMNHLLFQFKKSIQNI